MKWPWTKAREQRERISGIFKRLMALEKTVDGTSALSMYYGLSKRVGVLSRLRDIEKLLTPNCSCCKKSMEMLYVSQDSVKCIPCAEFLKPKKGKKK